MRRNYMCTAKHVSFKAVHQQLSKLHLKYLTVSLIHLYAQIHYYHRGHHRGFKIYFLFVYVLIFLILIDKTTE